MHTDSTVKVCEWDNVSGLPSISSRPECDGNPLDGDGHGHIRAAPPSHLARRGLLPVHAQGEGAPLSSLERGCDVPATYYQQ